jgi:cytochrome c-type biogenesis protein CcmH
MRKRREVFAVWLMLWVSALAHGADTAAPVAANPELEARVQRVAAELRCLVCQNQTIADSNAPLAEDLRREVRDMIGRGSSEDEVRDFMVQRYGDFILYRPPVKATTFALWLGPFLLLAVGIWRVVRIARARRKAATANSLSADDEARLARLTASVDTPERR